MHTRDFHVIFYMLIGCTQHVVFIFSSMNS